MDEFEDLAGELTLGKLLLFFNEYGGWSNLGITFKEKYERRLSGFADSHPDKFAVAVIRSWITSGAHHLLALSTSLTKYFRVSPSRQQFIIRERSYAMVMRSVHAQEQQDTYPSEMLGNYEEKFDIMLIPEGINPLTAVMVKTAISLRAAVRFFLTEPTPLSTTD